MNQEEREAFTQQTTQRIVASLHQTTNAEDAIRPMLTKYGIEMFAAGNRNTEEWISCMLAGLPIPIFITRTQPEGEGTKEPVLAYHWKIQDSEGDRVVFAYCLGQALSHLMNQLRQS
jgi:hypothetical protein